MWRPGHLAARTAADVLNFPGTLRRSDAAPGRGVSPCVRVCVCVCVRVRVCVGVRVSV